LQELGATFRLLDGLVDGHGQLGVDAAVDAQVGAVAEHDVGAPGGQRQRQEGRNGGKPFHLATITMWTKLFLRSERLFHCFVQLFAVRIRTKLRK
jgi:hypothetical protein